MNFIFDNLGQIKKLRKNSVIKNVKYITQLIGEEEVTIELNPPRNLKITNKAKK